MEKKQKLEKIVRITLGCGMLAGEFTICFFNGFGIGRILKDRNCGKATRTIAAVFVGALTPRLLEPVTEKALDYIFD